MLSRVLEFQLVGIYLLKEGVELQRLQVVLERALCPLTVRMTDSRSEREELN
jgi:hypothetical protein